VGAVPVTVVVAALIQAGCDLGQPETLPFEGPALRLLSTSPAPGEGTDCTPDSPLDCGVPVDAAIELRFDRFLLPSTAVRQSLSVFTGANGVFLVPTYDPAERIVLYRLPRGGTWLPNVRYTVELFRPSEHPEAWGFRAFDGAELSDEGPAPLRFTFRTRRDPTATAAPVGPPPTFAAVSEVLARGGCAASGCHRSPDPSRCPASGGEAEVGICAGPRMGLDLSGARGVETTALGQVAHQTDNGPYAGEVRAASSVGVGMPLIDRASPGSSYLYYKLLVNDRYAPGAPRCATRYSAPVPDGCEATLAAELARLRAAFVRGSPMPLGADGPAPRLPDPDLQLIGDWIASGATLE